MRSRGLDSENTRLILSAAYRSRGEAALSPQWQGRVMDAVRALPAKAVPERTSVNLERMVWRFAPMACLLIAAMAAVLISQDFSPQYGLLDAMMDDSMNTLLAQAVGIQ